MRFANAEEEGSIPGCGSSPGEGNGNLLHSSRLGNAMDRGARQATVHGVTNSRTRLSTHAFAPVETLWWLLTQTQELTASGPSPSLVADQWTHKVVKKTFNFIEPRSPLLIRHAYRIGYSG